MSNPALIGASLFASTRTETSPCALTEIRRLPFPSSSLPSSLRRIGSPGLSPRIVDGGVGIHGAARMVDEGPLSKELQLYRLVPVRYGRCALSGCGLRRH